MTRWDLIQDMPAHVFARLTPPREDLTPEEEQECREWARENYTAGNPINRWWHPFVIDECLRMNSAD